MIVAVNGYTNNHVAKFTFNLKSLFNARSASHVQLRLYNYHIIIYMFFESSYSRYLDGQNLIAEVTNKFLLR